MVILDIDMGYGLMISLIWEMTVSIWSTTISIWDILPLCEQSDKIWRIDLQDDHESCHPVGLRMTLKS